MRACSQGKILRVSMKKMFLSNSKLASEERSCQRLVLSTSMPKSVYYMT